MHKTITNIIHDKSPCGINIKNTQEYFSVKEKYDSIMINISSNSIKNQTSLITNVKNNVICILEKKSKDLELLLWFTYLSIMLEGIDGLIYSLQIIIEIIEKYFKTIHPVKTQYTNTEDEVIEVKINLINQLDLKVSKLVNEHTYVDNDKTINITTIIQFKNNSDSKLKQIIAEHSNKFKELLKKIEKSTLLLETISSELLQYDNYQNNTNIIIPKFKNLKQNFSNIKNQIECNISNKKNEQNTEQQVNNTKQNLQIKTNDTQSVINQILCLVKSLKNDNSYKIVAYAIEFCILKIPNNSIELAKIMRRTSIMSSFISEVIEFKEPGVDNNNITSDIINQETNNNIDKEFPEL